MPVTDLNDDCRWSQSDSLYRGHWDWTHVFRQRRELADHRQHGAL